jgi:hypothetical protein
VTEPPKTRLMPYAVSSGCACMAAIGLALLLRQPVAVYGAVAASFGALCGLASLAAFAGRGLNGVLLGFTLGFLARAVLVAVGLLASGARGNAALSYVFSFFGLYLATQLVEILFVARGAQGATP